VKIAKAKVNVLVQISALDALSKNTILQILKVSFYLLLDVDWLLKCDLNG